MIGIEVTKIFVFSYMKGEYSTLPNIEHNLNKDHKDRTSIKLNTSIPKSHKQLW